MEMGKVRCGSGGGKGGKVGIERVDWNRRT